MNKEHFNKLVSDYTSIDTQFSELEKLVDLYPYSQPLRVLSAKSSAQQSKVEYQKRLATAAFYTTDRNVLRTFIEKGKVPSDGELASLQKKPVPTKKPATGKTNTTKSIPASPESKKTINGDKLREEVIHNLDELIHTKADFFKRLGMAASTMPSVKPDSNPPIAIKPVRPSVSAPQKDPSTVKPSVTERNTSKVGARKTRKEDLIDKFIANEPTITPNKAVREKQSDLSRASSELKEDLVSENLAVIFANQGQTAKAIEIYKKLIWKFPQKKASFAARIEELKKK